MQVFPRGSIALLLAAGILAGCAPSGVNAPTPSASIGRQASIGSSAAPTNTLANSLTLTEALSESVGSDTVESVAFSPDGKSLAMGAGDGIVAIYPLQGSASEQAVVQKLHAGFVSALAWSPDGSRLLTAAADGAVRIWDVKSARVVHSFNVVPTTHPAAVWSSNGQQIAVAEGRDSVRLFAADGDGSPLQSFSLPGTTRAMLWLPNNEIAASDDQGRVLFFRQGKGSAAQTYQPMTPHKAVNSMSLSPLPGGPLAIGYDDGAIILIDPSTGRQIREFARGRSIGNVAWSPNGQVLASSSIEFALTFWDAEGKQLAKLNIGYDVNGVAWSPDGAYVAAGSDDHTFKVWRVSPAQTPSQTRPTPPDYMGR